MKIALISLFSLGTLALVSAAAWTGQAPPAVPLNQAIGKWRSTEAFEGEPRTTVTLKRSGAGIEGWAVMLGQTRRQDNRATLAMSFCGAAWDRSRFTVSTILPDDEGTIGWELRPTSATTAVLAALTENGKPLDTELKWQMTK